MNHMKGWWVGSGIPLNRASRFVMRHSPHHGLRNMLLCGCRETKPRNPRQGEIGRFGWDPFLLCTCWLATRVRSHFRLKTSLGGSYLCRDDLSQAGFLEVCFGKRYIVYDALCPPGAVKVDFWHSRRVLAKN